MVLNTARSIPYILPGQNFVTNTGAAADSGTKSSGTVTFPPTDAVFVSYTNGGAHTLAPSTYFGSFYIDITNNASAGAITTSGWTHVSGSFDTTNGHKFRCWASVGPAGSLLVVNPLQ
jgi:hypothetical protein